MGKETGVHGKKNNLFIHAEYRSFARIARRIRRRKVKGERFREAETFVDRDQLCRDFAAECYDLAKTFAAAKKHRMSLQYAKLAAKLLDLSLKPKKLSDLEQIKKALVKLQKREPAIGIV